MYRFLSRPRSKENNGTSHYFIFVKYKKLVWPEWLYTFAWLCHLAAFSFAFVDLKRAIYALFAIRRIISLEILFVPYIFFSFFFFLHLHILFSNVFSRAVEKFNKKIPRRKVAHVQFSLYQMLNPPKYTVNSTLQGVASLSFVIASLLDQMLSRLSTPSSKTKETFC